MRMDGSHAAGAETRRPLLLVSFEQFGYHTDTFEYCRYLRERYRITYLCPNQGLERKEMEGVEVLLLGRPPLGKVELGLLLEADRLLRSRRYDAAYLRRTKFSFLLRLRHPGTPMIFDVRSGSVEKGGGRRALENAVLRFNARCFRHITVISAGLACQLGLPRRAHVLPLGADRRPPAGEPPRDGLRLVYVGTFKNRCLEQTVDGLAKFIRKGFTDLPASYTLVGFGSAAERSAIRNAAEAAGLGDRVSLRQRVDRDGLPLLLSEHNVGVAFTPQVPWFEHQPSTKVFEYLQSGLLCIATDNAANREVISPANGVLVPGTADGFVHGLEEVTKRLADWNPLAVADTVGDHTWERIVAHNLAPYLEAVCGT